MLKIVVVMLEGAASVVGRINVDALHLSGIVREKSLEGVQIVALNEHVASVAVAVGQVRRFFEKAIGRKGGAVNVLLAGQPV